MKKIISLMLAIMMLVSCVPVAYAAENEVDYSAGTQVTLVGTQENQGAQWTVTVPAKMQPGQTGTVTATGTWAADQFINVHAPKTVTLTYGAQSMDVGISWSTGNCGMSKIGSNTDTVTGSARITVAEASRLFGTWEGILEYEVKLIENGDANRDGMITAEDKDVVKNAYLNSEELSPYMDLNGDGKLSATDANIVQGIIGGSCVHVAVNAVQPVEMITFTFNGTEYQAEKDMTWREWIDSPYNEIEKYDQVNGTGISVDYNGSIICSCAEHWLYLDEEEVQASEEIVENGGYYFQ